MSLGSYNSWRSHPKGTCPLDPCLLVLYISNNQSMETYQFTFIPNRLSATLRSPLSARRRGRQELAENTSMAKSRSPSMDTPKGKNRNEASAHPWTRRVVDSTVTQRELSERKHRGNRSYAPSCQERKHKSLRWSTSGSYWKRGERGLNYDE